MDIPDARVDLRDLSAAQLDELVAGLGEKPFRSKQIMGWLYRRDAREVGEMTDLSQGLRGRLEKVARLGWLEPAAVETSRDGTKKLLFALHDGAAVESVLIPEADHHTLCVSSQVGCRQGCRFCRTASLGFRRNLTPAEIMGQVLTARAMAGANKPLTNLVFMGMGEPLDNLGALSVALEHILGGHGLQMSQRKVTVSTVGLVPKMLELGRTSPAALAVSLNAPSDELRGKLMPVNRCYPLAKLHAAIAAYPLKPTRRVTLEYVLLAGVNDQPRHARELAKWVHGLKAKINLIPFNPHDGADFGRPGEEAVSTFQEELAGRHLTALVRDSRGDDISAACGQLAARKGGGR